MVEYPIDENGRELHYKRTRPNDWHGAFSPTISLLELEDICSIIAHKKWPDGQFGDDECNAWSVICRELGIDY